ncbi:MAG: hypothetical protein FJY80_06475 [Candidatus Aminicenantes bacterium]|nr:hypothetical protein [Candidatus Aminicenantes bacterium]
MANKDEKSRPFDPYRPVRPSLKERFGKTLLFAACVLAFGAAVAFFAILSGIPSSRDKEKYEDYRERAAALLRDVPVAVTAAGFALRRVGSQDLYVPSLTVLASNATGRAVEDIDLRAWFEGKEAFRCRAYGRIFRLQPGETAEASLQCVEPTLFGSVVLGVPLWKVSQAVEYGLTVRVGRVSAPAARGFLEPKILVR